MFSGFKIISTLYSKTLKKHPKPRP